MKIGAKIKLERLLEQEPLPSGEISVAVLEYVKHYGDDIYIQNVATRYERKMADNQ